jgi:aarF domain-containing kinase
LIIAAFKNYLLTLVARSLDEGLQTRQGSLRTFLILGRYAARTVYEEKLEGIRGSLLFWPPNWIVFLSAWTSYARVGLKLGLYEQWLGLRRLLGMEPIVVDSFQRDVV